MPHALIVDDDADAAETMATLIASEGFTVATARHRCATRGARSRCRSPTSCCSTCSCPTAAAWSCSTTPSAARNAEVVLITGHASVDTSIQALRLGAADYLVKPVDLKQLQGDPVARDAAVGAEGRDRRAARRAAQASAASAARGAARRRCSSVYEQIARVRRHRGHGAHHRRERHRQGARRADDPRPEPAPQRAVPRRQLRRDLAAR